MKRTVSLTLITLIAFATFGVFTPSLKASEPQLPTTINVINPLTGDNWFNFTTANESVGDDIIVNITVSNVVDLWAWQIRVGWNSSLLSYVNISLPSDYVFSGSGKEIYIGGPALVPEVDPDSVVYACVFRNVDPYWSFNGTGTLCQLTLRIIQKVGLPPLPSEVNCNLTLINPPPGLADTFMQDPRGGDIDFSPIDGYYDYKAVTTLSVSPRNVEFNTPVRFVYFDVYVLVKNVVGLYGYEFKLTWNRTLLYLVRVNVTPPVSWGFGNSSNYFIGVNNTDELSGTYWLAVTQFPSAPTFNGTASLVTLTFITIYDPIYPENVSCPLHLTDTFLSDNQANPIPHTDVDGRYSVISWIPMIVFEPNRFSNGNGVLINQTRTFQVGVEAWYVVGLYSYEIGISWDPHYLKLTGFVPGDFIVHLGHVYYSYFNEMSGYLGLGCTIDPPYGPIDDYVVDLAILNFTSLPYVWPDPDVNTTIAIDVENHCLMTKQGMSIENSIGLAQTPVMIKPIPGDINNDGRVDLVDMRLVAKAYGTRHGDTYWDPRADLNRDNLISVFDLVLVSKNYGLGVPAP